MLILDEPTNHLDLESREALEDALQSFPGSLILVTHDRALLDAVGTRTIAVEDYALRSYVGGWAEYARVREERKAMGLSPSSPPPPVTNGAARGRRSPRAKAAGRSQAQARRPVEEPRPRAGAPGARRRGGRGGARGRSRRSWPTPRRGPRSTRRAKSTARHTAAKRAVEEAYEALEAFEAKV